MSELVVVIFDNDLRADVELITIVRDRTAGQLAFEDAATVVKTQRGRLEVRETVRIPIGRNERANGWWGLLITLVIGGPAGASHYGKGFDELFGQLDATGIDRAFCTGLSESIEPGCSALFAHVCSDRHAGIARRLSRLDGRLMRTKLPESCVQAVGEALERSA